MHTPPVRAPAADARRPQQPVCLKAAHHKRSPRTYTARTLSGDTRVACARRRRVRQQRRRAARSSPVGLTPKLSLPSADREDPARQRTRSVRTSQVRAATAAVRRRCAGGALTVVARGFRAHTPRPHSKCPHMPTPSGPRFAYTRHVPFIERAQLVAVRWWEPGGFATYGQNVFLAFPVPGKSPLSVRSPNFGERTSPRSLPVV